MFTYFNYESKFEILIVHSMTSKFFEVKILVFPLMLHCTFFFSFFFFILFLHLIFGISGCGIMLLTIFYFAATWMQSRKLGSLRKKLVQFASTHSTVVFYKTVLEKNEKENEFFGVSISSPFCKNENKAMVGEVLHYTANTRSCVVIPKVSRDKFLYGLFYNVFI